MYWPGIDRERTSSDLIVAGPLRLDLGEQRATLRGQEVDLSPLLMRLLQILASRPRQLISRQQLKEELWPSSDRIDTERRLNTAMRALRAALNDNADAPALIETVRSHGYRWIGSAKGEKKASRRWPLALLFLVLVALVATAVALIPRGSRPAASPVALVKAQTEIDEWRTTPDAAHLAAAAKAVSDALSSAPSSPAAHVLKAQLALEAHWNWSLAAREYDEALKLDPLNGDARLGLAWLKVNRGDSPGAVADASELIRDSVLTGERRTDLGWLLIRAGRPDLATLTCPASASSINGLSCAHTALAAVGRVEQARTAAVRLMRLCKADPSTVQEVERMPAEAAYRTFLVWRARDFLPPGSPYFDQAQVLADAGFNGEALDKLARSIAAHEPLAVKIVSSPSFMSLRTNPRYQALVRTVGVPTS